MSANFVQAMRFDLCRLRPYQNSEPLPISSVPIFSLDAKISSSIDDPALASSITRNEALTECFLRDFLRGIMIPPERTHLMQLYFMIPVQAANPMGTKRLPMIMCTLR